MSDKKIIVNVTLLAIATIAICVAIARGQNQSETETESVAFTTIADVTTTEDVINEPTTEATTEATSAEPTTQASLFADYEIEALCKMVYGEAQTSPREQKRWVAIVALNHLDKHCNGGYTLWDIVTDTNQFNGYSANHPVTSEIREIVDEVIADYENGKVNWVDYYYFNSVGDGINNRFH